MAIKFKVFLHSYLGFNSNSTPFYGDKVDMWAIDRFWPGEIPKATTMPMPLPEPELELEGEEILFSDGWKGDSVNNSAVWVQL